MPLGFKPECFKCGGNYSEIWEKVEGKGTCCLSCSVKVEAADEEDYKSEDSKKLKDEKQPKSTKQGETVNGTKTVNGATKGRKAGKGKAKKAITTSKTTVPKGKGRRFIFKKRVYKSAPAICTIVNSTSLWFEGQYFQIGDIVSLRDVDGGIYYAQIRGLLQDQYCEKSAVISWLIPTRSSPSPEKGFLPESYILGPHEEIPRRLEVMEWVCHAPSDYYHAKGSPFPVGETPTRPELGFIWTNLGAPLIRPVPELQEMSRRGELDQE